VSASTSFIATINGIYKLSFTGSLKEVYKVSLSGIALSNTRFNCLAYDSIRQFLLCGSAQEGVFIIDTSGLLIDRLYDTPVSKKLFSNTIHSLLVDNNSLGYWVGTDIGITSFYWNSDLFRKIVIKDKLDGTNLKVSPIFIDDKNNMLIGTNKYLYRYNLSSQEQIIIKPDADKILRYSNITKIADSLFLFATSEGVYFSTGVNSQILRKISVKFPELGLMDNQRTYCILSLNANEIFFGMGGTGGLIRWNIKERSAIGYIPKNNV